MDPRPPEETPQVELPSQETLKNIVTSVTALVEGIKPDEISGNSEAPFQVDTNSGITISKVSDANRQLKPEEPVVDLDL